LLTTVKQTEKSVGVHTHTQITPKLDRVLSQALIYLWGSQIVCLATMPQPLSKMNSQKFHNNYSTTY